MYIYDNMYLCNNFLYMPFLCLLFGRLLSAIAKHRQMVDGRRINYKNYKYIRATNSSMYLIIISRLYSMEENIYIYIYIYIYRFKITRQQM